MDANKTNFQSLSLRMEDALKRYKNQYPKNLGVLIRNGFPVMLLVFSLIILPITAISYVLTTGNFVIFLAIIFILPVLTIFSIVMIIKNKRDKIVDVNLPNEIESLKSKIVQYKDYSDVAKYIDGFNRQISETDKAKQKYRSIYRLIIGSVCFVVVAYVAGCIMWITNFDSCTNHGFEGETEILGLKKGVPFLTLTPLKTDIDDNHKVISPNIEVFYQSDNLIVKEINISGTKEGDIFRMIITNKDGQMIPNCPRFIFKASETNKINSFYFCSYRQISDTDSVSYSVNSFEGLETCRYLIEHKNELRFLVDIL